MQRITDTWMNQHGGKFTVHCGQKVTNSEAINKESMVPAEREKERARTHTHVCADLCPQKVTHLQLWFLEMPPNLEDYVLEEPICFVYHYTSRLKCLIQGQEHLYTLNKYCSMNKWVDFHVCSACIQRSRGFASNDQKWLVVSNCLDDRWYVFSVCF